MGNVTNILVIDGQGGGLGKQLVSALKGLDNIRITAVGTNSAATAAMHKAGADRTATGENSVIVACRDADIDWGRDFFFVGKTYTILGDMNRRWTCPQWLAFSKVSFRLLRHHFMHRRNL